MLFRSGTLVLRLLNYTNGFLGFPAGDDRTFKPPCIKLYLSIYLPIGSGSLEKAEWMKGDGTYLEDSVVPGT